MQSLVLQCTQSRKSKGSEKNCAGSICNGRKQTKRNFSICKSKCDSCLAIERMQRRKEKQNFVNTRKVEVGACEYCNQKCEKNNCHLFEWDHIFGKNSNVSKLITCSSRVICNEIALCRLLCVKCHRLKSTLEARGEWDGKPSSFIKLM